MARLTLSAEEDYSFNLLGISCHAKDYRLCWAINSALGIELEKREAKGERSDKTLPPTSILDTTPFKGNFIDQFTIYSCFDNETYIGYTLINNHGTGGYFAPEQKMANYFLKIEGDLADDRKQDIVKQIKALDFVLAVFDVDIKKLKSKQNFLF